MGDRKNLLLTLLLMMFSLAAAFTLGYFTHSFLYPAELEFPLLADAYAILRDHALRPLPESSVLEYGMIHGMLDAYDDAYTVFLEPPERELEVNQLEGQYGGIGVDLGRDAENYIVLYPFPEGPAALAGVRDGDRLISIDRQEITPETPMDDAEAELRGPLSQRVQIAIARPPDYLQQEFSIRRQNFPLPSVTWRTVQEEPRLGIIQVNLIAASTSSEILKAVADLQKQGVTHFALDLRDNSGGLLEAGVDVARLFLSDGIVIQQQYRGDNVQDFQVTQAGALADFPLVVLVNERTASAAEIVAGALQAHGRAPVIGTPTFGKNTIQLVFDLRDDSSLHVTAGQWWIPGLVFPSEGGGLQPDIFIPPDAAGFDPAIQAALQVFFGE